LQLSFSCYLSIAAQNAVNINLFEGRDLGNVDVATDRSDE
jgi:hypothetical protein